MPISGTSNELLAMALLNRRLSLASCISIGVVLPFSGLILCYFCSWVDALSITLVLASEVLLLCYMTTSGSIGCSPSFMSKHVISNYFSECSTCVKLAVVVAIVAATVSGAVMLAVLSTRQWSRNDNVDVLVLDVALRGNSNELALSIVSSVSFTWSTMIAASYVLMRELTAVFGRRTHVVRKPEKGDSPSAGVAQGDNTDSRSHNAGVLLWKRSFESIAQGMLRCTRISMRLGGATVLVACAIAGVHALYVAVCPHFDSEAKTASDAAGGALGAGRAGSDLTAHAMLLLQAVVHTAAGISLRAIVVTGAVNIIHDVFTTVLTFPMNMVKAAASGQSSASEKNTTVADLKCAVNMVTDVFSAHMLFNDSDFANFLTSVEEIQNSRTATTAPAVVSNMLGQRGQRGSSPPRHSMFTLNNIRNSATAHQSTLQATKFTDFVDGLVLRMLRSSVKTAVSGSADATTASGAATSDASSNITLSLLAQRLTHKALESYAKAVHYRSGSSSTLNNCPTMPYLKQRMLLFNGYNCHNLAHLLALQFVSDAIFPQLPAASSSSADGSMHQKDQEKVLRQLERTSQRADDSAEMRRILFSNSMLLCKFTVSMLMHLKMVTLHMQMLQLYCDTARCAINTAKFEAVGNLSAYIGAIDCKPGNQSAAATRISIEKLPSSSGDARNSLTTSTSDATKKTEEPKQFPVTAPTARECLEILCEVSCRKHSAARTAARGLCNRVVSTLDHALLRLLLPPKNSVALGNFNAMDDANVRFGPAATSTTKVVESRPDRSSSGAGRGIGIIHRRNNIAHIRVASQHDKSYGVIDSNGAENSPMLYASSSMALSPTMLHATSTCVLRILPSILVAGLSEDGRDCVQHMVPAVVKALIQLDLECNSYIAFFCENYYVTDTAAADNELKSLKLLRSRALVLLPEVNALLVGLKEAVQEITFAYRDVLFRNTLSSSLVADATALQNGNDGAGSVYAYSAMINDNTSVYKSCFTTDEWCYLYSNR